MTIEFNCPNCKAVIAFADKHGGKQGHCTSCQQRFIIPFRSREKAEKVKPPEEKGEPIPGFYKAALVDSWKLFTDSDSMTGLVFIVVAVCIKFFTARMNYTMIIPGRSLTFEFFAHRCDSERRGVGILVLVLHGDYLRHRSRSG
jgi:hypothetical protein